MLGKFALLFIIFFIFLLLDMEIINFTVKNIGTLTYPQSN